jgi:hypothetical protein
MLTSTTVDQKVFGDQKDLITKCGESQIPKPEKAGKTVSALTWKSATIDARISRRQSRLFFLKSVPLPVTPLPHSNHLFGHMGSGAGAKTL